LNNGIAYRFTTRRGSKVWIAQISEVIKGLTQAQIESYHEGHSLERAHQLACADALASAMLGHTTRIYRDDAGAPHLPEVLERISISHTGDFMAMLVSTSPLLALDIELTDRNIDRIIPRYTSESEVALYDRLPAQNPALWVWGIKECLFKAVPVKGILFREHLKIRKVDLTAAIYSACEIVHPDLRAQLSVVSHIFGPLIVSYIDQPLYGYEEI